MEICIYLSIEWKYLVSNFQPLIHRKRMMSGFMDNTFSYVYLLVFNWLFLCKQKMRFSKFQLKKKKDFYFTTSQYQVLKGSPCDLQLKITTIFFSHPVSHVNIMLAIASKQDVFLLDWKLSSLDALTFLERKNYVKSAY